MMFVMNFIGLIFGMMLKIDGALGTMQVLSGEGCHNTVSLMLLFNNLFI